MYCLEEEKCLEWRVGGNGCHRTWSDVATSIGRRDRGNCGLATLAMTDPIDDGLRGSKLGMLNYT